VLQLSRRISACVLVVSVAGSARAAGQGVGGEVGEPAKNDAQRLVSLPVVTREAGQTRVRAIHLTAPIRLDGRLDEEVYQITPPISDFIQTIPREGQPASEKTDAWVMYDDNNMYVSCRCWDSAPPERWTANELRRDTNQLRQNDMFGVLFDTFHDRRNGFNFYTNPLGGRADQHITDEGNPNVDWNPVWDVRTGRFDGGWTVEMAIPFKSLRYRSGRDQTWGIQLRRAIRRKNEWTHLTFVPAATGGSQSIFRVSAAATLEGLDLPSASRNIEVKPYAISRVTTDRGVTPAVSNDADGDIGGDAKIGITANLTADVTYNTDFAQVEVDEQQVNLTRFVLSFPEKRDFFLEGRGIFDFGRGGNSGGGGGGGNSGVTPTLFYSRRIGLNRSRVIPIDVGGRVTGKVGKFAVGLMNIQTGEESASATDPTNFTVVRVKRDILRRSSVGALFTNRSKSTAAAGSNQAFGVDAAFSFFQNVAMGGYYARSETPGLSHDNDSYQGRFDYGADRYGARFEYLKVGDNFNPEVGLVRRDDFKRSFGSLRFSPRPRSIEFVRKFTWEANLEYLVNGAGQLETRQPSASFATEFENSDQFSIDATNNYELLVRPFNIAPGVIIPAGGYTFNDATVRYMFGQQRRASGSVSLQRGQFYDGTITAVGYSGGRVSILKQLSAEPSLSINRVELPYGDFTQTVIRARSDYAFSPRMFASGLVQYSSTDRAFSSNLRFRWEYLPGSELFVVYTDERDTLVKGFPDLKNRAFVVKINRLMQF
jgi:uncharacterized protein DUF5916